MSPAPSIISRHRTTRRCAHFPSGERESVNAPTCLKVANIVARKSCHCSQRLGLGDQQRVFNPATTAV